MPLFALGALELVPRKTFPIVGGKSIVLQFHVLERSNRRLEAGAPAQTGNQESLPRRLFLAFAEASLNEHYPQRQKKFLPSRVVFCLPLTIS
jgi:hypothetical protein